MSGDVCLQGGGELQPGCEAMDSLMLLDAGLPRRVLVAPYAGRPGREQQTAATNVRRWYEGLGATHVDVVAQDELGQVLAGAEDALLVLPGGSPSRLLDALVPHADALARALAAGVAISGASAGAMVLCRWVVLPERGRRVVPGLSLVPVDLVLPHFSGDAGWLDAARPQLPERPDVLGLPERSGVVVRGDGSRAAVGASPVATLS